jgi:CBS domain-containing protein
VPAPNASSSIVTASVVAFLQGIPPFQFLSAAELGVLASGMSVEYFPKDTIILTAGHQASESLYIVQKGGVKLSIRGGVGKELVLDMRSEGEIFGLLSLLGRDVARLDVTAIEDTICYTVPGSEVQKLISRHAEVADFFFRTSVTRYMDRSLNELREQSRLLGEGERLLYSLSVSDVVAGPAVTCCRSTPIQEAARMMSAANGTCLFVVDSQGQAVGIVTEKDFAAKVVARGLPLDLPVERIMSAPVVAVESNQMVFQALVAMLSHDIHHVLVTTGGLPTGTLSHHDLMLLQGKSPLNLVRHMEQQRSLEDLAAAQKRIGNLMPLLMREGARASHITRVVAEVNDRLMSKILALAEGELGPAPVAYCWVVLGSEGRSEQTFKTDQDNALIYADAVPDQRPAAEQYFTSLAEFAHNALARCGYPPCEGGYMASNPRWRQPLAVWKDYFRDWIAGAERRSTEDALIFFDMRPVAGDSSLFAALATHTQELLKTESLFQSVLAYVSIDHKPPLGFFRTFVVERTGQHKNELDLKLHGTGPIVNAARLLALVAGLGHTNTVDRLAALESIPGQDPALLKDLQAAFEFLTLLRLECQLRQARAGRPAGNYIQPETLSNLQKSTLKQAFQTIARVQSQIEARFRSAEWSLLAR